VALAEATVHACEAVVKPTKPAAVETSADMWPGVGEICLTERDGG
jgi:hypothetical protein